MKWIWKKFKKFRYLFLLYFPKLFQQNKFGLCILGIPFTYYVGRILAIFNPPCNPVDKHLLDCLRRCFENYHSSHNKKTFATFVQNNYKDLKWSIYSFENLKADRNLWNLQKVGYNVLFLASLMQSTWEINWQNVYVDIWITGWYVLYIGSKQGQSCYWGKGLICMYLYNNKKT